MNTQESRSPVAAIREVLGGKKVLFLCIVYGVAALMALIDVFANKPDFSGITDIISAVAGVVPGAGQLKALSSQLSSILNGVATAIFVFNLICVLPQILVAVAFWMVRMGASPDEKSTKMALLGFDFFKFNFLFKASLQGMGVVLPFIAVFYLLGILPSSVSGLGPALFLCAAIVAGVCGFYLRYSLGYLKMLQGTTHTLRTNINMMTASKLVIIFNYINAAFAFLGAFGNGFWAFVSSVCQGLCLIFVSRCFVEYSTKEAFLTKEQLKTLKEQISNDPTMEHVAATLCLPRPYSADPAAQKPTFAKSFYPSFYGLSLAYNVEDEGFAPTPAGGFTPAPAKPVYTPAAPAAPAAHSVKSKQPAYRRAADITAELPVHVLPLFSATEAVTDPRYQQIGARTYPAATAPVEPRSAEVLVDSISEKRILRLSFENRSPEPVCAIRLTVIPKTNESSALGILKDVTVPCAVSGGGRFGGELGLILPDEATCGTAQITYVAFENGLFRDKPGEVFHFSTAEKSAFDTTLYLSAMGH